MKKMYLFCFCVLLPLAACDPYSLDGHDVRAEDGGVYHEMIELGEKLNDPYTVDNMRAALNETYGTRAGRIEIKATHKYVRFLPASDEQYGSLLASGLELMDHPLDFRIAREGDYYHDPDVPEGEITWQYAVVPADYTPPYGVRVEVLDDCFIPSEETTKASEQWIDWGAVERRSYELTGNSEMLGTMTKSGDVSPSGRISIVDEKYNGGEPIGVSGVKVSVNTFVKFASTYTDRDGYYSIDKEFSSDIRYRIVFKNVKGFGIGVNLILVPASVSTLGKSDPKGMDVQITRDSDRKLFCRSVVNNAAYDYFSRCSAEETQVKAPPANLRLWIFQFLGVSSTPMLQQGTVLDRSVFAQFLGSYSGLIKMFLPDITVGVDGYESYSSIYSQTSHELAHASHFMTAGIPYWDKFIDFIIRSYITSGWVVYGVGTEKNAGYCKVGEMWGYYMENKLYKERYGEYYGNVGTSYWFHPQVFLYMDERGMTDGRIFKALGPDVASGEELKSNLLLLYPEYRSVIEQAFDRYE